MSITILKMYFDRLRVRGSVRSNNREYASFVEEFTGTSSRTSLMKVGGAWMCGVPGWSWALDVVFIILYGTWIFDTIFYTISSLFIIHYNLYSIHIHYDFISTIVIYCYISELYINISIIIYLIHYKLIISPHKPNYNLHNILISLQCNLPSLLQSPVSPLQSPSLQLIFMSLL